MFCFAFVCSKCFATSIASLTLFSPKTATTRSISYVTFNLVEQLSLLEPFGKGNTKPLFADKDLKLKVNTELQIEVSTKERNIIYIVIIKLI